MIKILFNFLFLIFILELFINYLIFGVNSNKHRHHKSIFNLNIFLFNKNFNF